MDPVPAFRHARCVRYRFRYSACRRCLEACPHGAIEATDAGIGVALERCRNCALCTRACPTGALVPGNLPRIDLLKRAIGGPRFAFACAPSGRPADAIVPCLGALDAAMLAYLARRGVAVELRGTGHCARCEHAATGAPQLASNLEGFEMLRGIAGGEPWPAVERPVDDGPGGPPPDGFRSGRRQLFRRLAGGAVHEVLRDREPDPEPPEKAIRAAPPAPADMRELLQLVCKPAGDAPFNVRAHPALPMGRMALADGCTQCEACFRACPTGAIDIAETDASWALVFAADRCVACGVCSEVCQPAALRPVEAWDASPRDGAEVLLRMRKQRCARCDRFFVSTEPRESCPVCADDEEAFAAIFG